MKCLPFLGEFSRVESIKPQVSLLVVPFVNFFFLSSIQRQVGP